MSETRETTVGALSDDDLGCDVVVEGLTFRNLAAFSHDVDEDGLPGMGTEISAGSLTMWMQNTNTPCTVSVPAVVEGGEPK